MSRDELLSSSAVPMPVTGNKSDFDATPLGDDHRPSDEQAPDEPQRSRRSSPRRNQRRRGRRRPKKRSLTDDDLLTTAEYRRCSPRTVERERETGCGCPFVRLGGRVLYRRADIERYIEQQVRGLKREAAE